MAASELSNYYTVCSTKLYINNYYFMKAIFHNILVDLFKIQKKQKHSVTFARYKIILTRTR
jgi:hypothetical protein